MKKAIKVVFSHTFPYTLVRYVDKLQIHSTGGLAMKKARQPLTKNYHHAVLLFGQNHNNKALCCCRDILAQCPGHADTLHLMGDISFEKQSFAQAAGYFQQALKNHEDKSGDYHALGKTFVKMKKFKPAESALLKAAQLAPRDINVLLTLGNFMKDQQRIRAAAACYERAISINPSLPELYLNLGSMQSILEETESAIFNFQVVCEMDPENMTAKHMLAALQGKTTDAAPEQHIQTLFNRCSSGYDTHMVRGLGYRVPDLMFNLLKSTDTAHRFFDNALDLGCGTGLGGMIFRDRCKRLSGIDLALKMIKMSRKKSIYDALHVGNILEVPGLFKEEFDLFIASDVLVYIGNLTPLFQSLEKCSRPHGLFIFSTESLGKKGYKLRPSGRYAHSKAYIKTTAENYNFQCSATKTEHIRREKGDWIEGDIWIFIYKAGSPGKTLV